MFKTTAIVKQLVQNAFPSVSERGMTNVVKKRSGFDKVFVELQCPANGTCYADDFHGVCQPGTMVVSKLGSEHLHFFAESTKGGAVDNSISIPLKRPAIRMRRFRITPPCRPRSRKRIQCQRKWIAVSQENRRNKNEWRIIPSGSKAYQIRRTLLIFPSCPRRKGVS